MSYLVAKPEDRFSRDEAHLNPCLAETKGGGLRFQAQKTGKMDKLEDRTY